MPIPSDVQAHLTDEDRAELETMSLEEMLQKYKKKPSSNNKGVYWNKGKEKWEARITKDGVWRYLGAYERKEDAAIAYQKEARRHER